MKNSRTLLGGIVHFRNFDTHAPQVGPSFLSVIKEKAAIAQPHQGIEHGALSRNSQMFTPVPITPTSIFVTNLLAGAALVYPNISLGPPQCQRKCRGCTLFVLVCTYEDFNVL